MSLFIVINCVGCSSIDNNDAKAGIFDFFRVKDEVDESVIVIDEDQEFVELMKEKYLPYLEEHYQEKADVRYHNAYSTFNQEFFTIEVYFSPKLSKDECLELVNEYYDYLSDNTFEIYNGLALGILRLHKRLCFELNFYWYNCKAKHEHKYDGICFDEIVHFGNYMYYKDSYVFPNEWEYK